MEKNIASEETVFLPCCFPNATFVFVLFSISWTLNCTGDEVGKRGGHIEQREKLGLTPMPKVKSNTHNSHPEQTEALQKVEVCITYC